MAEGIEELRLRAGAVVRSFLTGEARPAVERLRPPGGDVGLFGPGSATWQVHGDLAMVVGGVRALFLQMLHPLAMAAVADHSDYRTNGLGRLHRTAGFLAATTFGSTAVAEQAIAAVRAVHERVSGVAPDGRPYRASDPHLL
ncbi:MAG: oxygenase MpaB family protein, partial [Acidimicrobiales bacterium]